MAAVIKIKPIPPNTTEAEVRSEINSDWIEEVIVDHVDHVAYVKLKGPQYLEALAGQFGEDLSFPVWIAKGEIEEESFDWQKTVDAVKQKATEVQAHVAEAVEAGKEKVSQVASDIHAGAETLATQAKAKVEEATEKIADAASKVSDKVAEHVEAAKSATADAIQAGKEKLADAANATKSTISSAVDSAREKVGSVVEAGKAKIEEHQQGCSAVLRKLEEAAEPIDPLPPKHRSRLIEFVLLVWLFSLMI